MRLTRGAAALLLVWGFMLVASGCLKERLQQHGSLTVLTLIDCQRDYLQADGRMPVAQNQVEPLIEAVNAMISAMQQHALPVIYTLNDFNPFEAFYSFIRNYAAMRYEPGATLDPRINTVAGVYFAKGNSSAFANPQFVEHLELIGAGRLVLAGTYADRSVLRTAQEAMKRGYKVTVISDAIAGANAQRRKAALRQLEQAGAQVETSAQFIASLAPAASGKG